MIPPGKQKEQEPAPSRLSAPARTAFDGGRLPRRERPQGPSPVPAGKAGKSRRVVRIAATAPDARILRANWHDLHQVDPDIFLREKESAPCRSRHSCACGFHLIVGGSPPMQITPHGHTSGAASRPCHPRIGPLYRATPDFPPGVARCFFYPSRNLMTSAAGRRVSFGCGIHLTFCLRCLHAGSERR